jgi:hypothetical protein
MLRYMADRNYCPIVEVERNDACPHAIPALTLPGIGGNAALAGGVRDQAEQHTLFRCGSGLGLTLLEATAIEDRPHTLPENRSADADGLRTDRADPTSRLTRRPRLTSPNADRSKP